MFAYLQLVLQSGKFHSATRLYYFLNFDDKTVALFCKKKAKNINIGTRQLRRSLSQIATNLLMLAL